MKRRSALRSPFVLSSWLGVVLLCGCGAGGGGQEGDDVSSNAELGTYPSIAIFGTVKAASGPGAPSPVAGAAVCVADYPSVPCVTSAADGSYRLAGVPKSRDVEVTVFAWGYLATNMLFHAKTDFAFHPVLLTDAAFHGWTAIAGGSVSPWTGLVTGFAYALDAGHFPANADDEAAGITGLAGFSFAISAPQVGAPTAVTSYIGGNGVPDASLTATSAVGQMGFVGVNGDAYYEIDATRVPAGYRCNHDFLQQGLSAGTIKVHVRPGFSTGFWVRCVPKP